MRPSTVLASQAAQYYQQALELCPANAVEEMATANNQLGIIYAEGGQVDAALHHFREAIRFKEVLGDRHSAGGTRCNVALLLARVRRLVEAREWDRSALRDFEACDNADREIFKVLRLLEEIESARRASSQRS